MTNKKNEALQARDDILETFKDVNVYYNNPMMFDFLRGRVDALVECIEERNRGEWGNQTRVAFHYTCSECGCHIHMRKDWVFEGNYEYNFCPNCGADMREADK